MGDALYQAANRMNQKRSVKESVREIMEGKPTRFIYDKRPLKNRKGMTKRKYMQPIKPGDPRYEDAIFEERIIWRQC